MNWNVIQPIAAQAARDFLRTVGMGLAAHGFIQEGAGVESFIGAGMTLAGLFWGWWTTSGYLQVGALLQKLTASHSHTEAVEKAQALPPADPATVNKTIIKVVTSVLLVAFVLSAFLAVPSAQAQTRQPPIKPLTGDVAKDFNLKPQAQGGSGTTADDAMGSLGSQVRKITKDLVDKAISDVQAASDDADKHKDMISKPCWDANLALLKGLPSQWENPPQEIGIALGIQIQRDLLNSITGNDATSLKVACAALWGDQLKIVANVGALLGIRLATGGLF